MAVRAINLQTLLFPMVFVKTPVIVVKNVVVKGIVGNPANHSESVVAS